MVFPKAQANTSGKTAVPSKEISNKVSEMVMEYGKPTTTEYNLTKVTTQWIKNQVMASICGTTDGFIKAILMVIIETVMENYTMEMVN